MMLPNPPYDMLADTVPPFPSQLRLHQEGHGSTELIHRAISHTLLLLYLQDVVQRAEQGIFNRVV